MCTIWFFFHTKRKRTCSSSLNQYEQVVITESCKEYKKNIPAKNNNAAASKAREKFWQKVADHVIWNGFILQVNIGYCYVCSFTWKFQIIVLLNFKLNTASKSVTIPKWRIDGNHVFDQNIAQNKCNCLSIGLSVMITNK